MSSDEQRIIVILVTVFCVFLGVRDATAQALSKVHRKL